jgi:hypothetical protein
VNIRVRWIGGRYAELLISDGDMELSTGPLTEAERKELSLALAEASSDLQLEDRK